MNMYLTYPIILNSIIIVYFDAIYGSGFICTWTDINLMKPIRLYTPRNEKVN